jgi:hypothetical protein
VTTCKQHRNGPTHRISDRDHTADSKRPTYGGCIVGTIFEREIDVRSQTSTMATMVNADYRRMRRKFVVCGEEVEVARSGPTV